MSIQVTLKGNIGMEAIEAFTTTGKRVAKTTIAVHQGDKTIWYALHAWEKAARFLLEAPVGSFMKIVGNLREESWTDKQGQKRFRNVVNANQVYILKKAIQPSLPYCEETRYGI